MLRDYHSPNLLWLPQRDDIARIGVLDFQDALIGFRPPQERRLAAAGMRVDIPDEVEMALLSRYVRARQSEDREFDMALASAQRFVEEGAYVFITGQRQEALDKAVKLIGRNVTGVRGDAANLDDLDRLFDTVKREKGKSDILYASAGTGEAVPLGEITSSISMRPSA